ncbi:MAG: flagellin, partial [Candidatus Nitrosotalea sp.]|nr:flagellin [Candidatus Nitrosotalea sp.]
MKHRVQKTRRGVIGIESAIVMIAFVIVAAALA